MHTHPLAITPGGLDCARKILAVFEQIDDRAQPRPGRPSRATDFQEAVALFRQAVDQASVRPARAHLTLIK